MRCPYCNKEVEPDGINCPKCRAAIVKKETKPEPIMSAENPKEVK
jgi:DNA-directed RNA polymerase subunit RPC12/RpoP